MSFSAIVIIVIHLVSCVCWTLKHSSIFFIAVVKNLSYVCQPSENKVFVFLQIQPSGSSHRHAPKSECWEGCLPEPLPLLRASETQSFSLSLALISFSKFSFQLLTLISLFSIYSLSPHTHTFLAMPPPGLNYFFFLCFLSTIFRIYNLGIKKKSIFT